MRIQDLHPDLSQQFSYDRKFGVLKSDVGGYENIYFVIPRPLPVSKTDSVIAKMPNTLLRRASVKAFAAINSQKNLEEMDGTDRLISRLIHRQEALSSSRIEGTFSTIDEIFNTESSMRTHDSQTHKTDALSILSYAKVMDLIFERVKDEKEKGITLSLFNQIHSAIVSSDPSYYAVPGELRTPGKDGAIVQISRSFRKEESTYNPAPPQHVKWIMEDFVAWLADVNIREEGDAGLGISLPIRMALAHAHFEAIHPYPDGNGRVGRLIWPIQMILSGIAPIHISGYIEAEKEGYYEGLKAYQQRLDPLPLINYLAEALASSKIEEEMTRSAIRELPNAWFERVRPRKGSTADRILPLLLSLPILSAEETTAELGVSLPAALAGLESLQKAGILEESTGRQRRKKWVAREVLTVLNRPYGLSPKDALLRAKANGKV